ncbi:MAG: ankyrin repeat domain-containing protein [Bacteroidia bacterium]
MKNKIFLVLLAIVTVFYYYSCIQNKPDSIRNKYGGTPYYEPNTKVRFVCARGDYNSKKSDLECDVEERMEAKGYFCGNFAQGYCFEFFRDNPPNVETCDFLAGFGKSIEFKEKCLSHFVNEKAAVNSCEDALERSDIKKIVYSHCLDGKTSWKNKDGRSALMLALMLDLQRPWLLVPDVEYLVNNTDDPNYQDKDGNTALHYARDAMLNWVMARIYKTTVNARLLNNLHESILISLFKHKQNPMSFDVETLVRKYHLDVNVRDVEGKTALHYFDLVPGISANPNYKPELKKMLIDLGADPNIKDNDGHVPGQ